MHETHFLTGYPANLLNVASHHAGFDMTDVVSEVWVTDHREKADTLTDKLFNVFNKHRTLGRPMKWVATARRFKVHIGGRTVTVDPQTGTVDPGVKGGEVVDLTFRFNTHNPNRRPR